MSDMTQDQIRVEFARQVRLCSGLGYAEMKSILDAEMPLQHYAEGGEGLAKLWDAFEAGYAAGCDPEMEAMWGAKVANDAWDRYRATLTGEANNGE